MTDWELLEPIDVAGFRAARVEAHAAAQVVSLAGRSLLPVRDDDSHTSLSWSAGIAGLVGEPLPDENVRTGLRLAELVLCVVDAEGRTLDAHALAGWTAADARHWLAGALTGRVDVGRPLAQVELPVALAAERSVNAPFMKHSATALLATYYANTNRLLAERIAGTRPIRVWPHHFDIAVLLDGPRPEQTIGVGMSPGDGAYPEPYWYVTPWPYPDTAKLPPLQGGGGWHTDHWVGAVLAAGRLDRGDAAMQCEQVATFMASAIAAARGLLARSP